MVSDLFCEQVLIVMFRSMLLYPMYLFHRDMGFLFRDKEPDIPLQRETTRRTRRIKQNDSDKLAVLVGNERYLLTR
jgi:hypothetical protein